MAREKNLFEFPVKYFENNLLFSKSRRACWAGYQIEGFSYDYLSAEKKINMLNATTRFVANIGTEAKILIVPTAQAVGMHYDRIIQSLDRHDALYDIAREHAQGTKLYLEEQASVDGVSNEYRVFLFTRLPEQKRSGTFFQKLIQSPVRTIEEFMDVNTAEIYENEIRNYQTLAAQYEREQSNRLRIRRLSALDLQWLFKRMARRGLSGEILLHEGKENKAWNPAFRTELKSGERAIRPYERDILTLAESTIFPEERCLRVLNSDGRTSYQTFLTVSDIPDGIGFPGGEWLLMLQDFAVPTEVCIHISNIEYRESERKLDNKKREIDSQIEHVAQNDRVPDELWAAQENVETLKQELKPANDPLTRASITICTAAESKEEMTANANFIKDRYEDVHFGIERPMSDQYKLFMEFIPGTGRYVTDYILPLPPKTLAGSMFPASRLLGDNEGHYIGTTGILMKKVFLNLAQACQRNRSASAAVIGTLGGGKSFLSNLLLVLHCLTGAKALIIDPKGERTLWPETLPGFADQITVTTLSAGKEDQGKLDPFFLYRDNLDEACDLAKDILCELYGMTNKDEEYFAMTEALQVIKTVDKPCMTKLVEILKNFDDDDTDMKTAATRLARRIVATRNIGMSRLLFGEGDEEGLNFDAKINIVQIQNLELPEPDTPRDDYNEREQISTVLMLPIATFAKRFARIDKKHFKLVLFDESWALNTTKAGTALFNFLARMGRSLNAGAIFIGHSVSDLKGDGIKAAITYKFCFKAKVNEEVARVLDFLDLEQTQENIELVKNLENGHCLFQDLEGHVGELAVDPVWDDFVTAFNTTPTSEEHENEE